MIEKNLKICKMILEKFEFYIQRTIPRGKHQFK